VLINSTVKVDILLDYLAGFEGRSPPASRIHLLIFIIHQKVAISYLYSDGHPLRHSMYSPLLLLP